MLTREQVDALQNWGVRLEGVPPAEHAQAQAERSYLGTLAERISHKT